jgi:hypothetical protein
LTTGAEWARSALDAVCAHESSQEEHVWLADAQCNNSEDFTENIRVEAVGKKPNGAVAGIPELKRQQLAQLHDGPRSHERRSTLGSQGHCGGKLIENKKHQR